MKKIFVSLAAFSYAATICASANTLSQSKNFFQPRAFSANLAREMLLEGFEDRESKGWYGTFSADAVFQRSWQENNENYGITKVNGLGAFPFWGGSNSMTVGTNDGTTTLDAYQFGLGNVLNPGTIILNPFVYQAGTDLMFTTASSTNYPCFFAKIKATLGIYHINTNLIEAEATPTPYLQGQLSVSTSTVPVIEPAHTMTQAFTGQFAGGQAQHNGDFIPMQFGLINGDLSTGARFGDIELTAGYRYISEKDNAVSIAIRAGVPTGNKPLGILMLEPIFGRGGNWALGGYVDGLYHIWTGDNHNHFDIRFMANAMHLFSTNTVRSYDLIENGQGSKYLLVGNFANLNYNGQIQNLINVSTLDSTSSFAVEGDAAVTLRYVARSFSIDFGYEFWGRSAETLEISNNADFAINTYAVLGRQQVGTNASAVTPATATLLCQPNATISSSVTPINSQTPATPVQTVSISNLLTLQDFDIPAAAQDTAMTSKFFTKLTYEWISSNHRPHLGAMAELEFSNSNNNALPQWAIALMGGVSF